MRKRKEREPFPVTVGRIGSSFYACMAFASFSYISQEIDLHQYTKPISNSPSNARIVALPFILHLSTFHSNVQPSLRKSSRPCISLHANYYENKFFEGSIIRTLLLIHVKDLVQRLAWLIELAHAFQALVSFYLYQDRAVWSVLV